MTDVRIDDGLRIYRDGRLPNGEPITAIVAGDVPILGTQFSCESCHGRSGMGTGENEYIVPPVSGPFLFSESPQPARAAYTHESLAAVLRDGITPSGRMLSIELMPRYVLDDPAMRALTGYLETLSAGNSPGVTDTQIRFATVIAGDVDPERREAVLAVIRKFFEEKNRQTRLDGERWDRGYTPESRLPTVFREWVLDAWVLTGPPDTWEAQLDRYYGQQPVFATVSGLAAGSWDPIGRFCEREKLPCLYPSTDRPWEDADNYYTIHFSRGLGLEADLVASRLLSAPPATVIQVYCNDDGEWAAERLEEALAQSSILMEKHGLDCELGPDRQFAIETADRGDTATVLWVDTSAVRELIASVPPGRIFLSSIFMGELDRDMPLPESGQLYVAHAFNLPGQLDAPRKRFDAWSMSRSIEVTAARAQAEAFYACLVLGDSVRHIGRFFIRDFMLDMVEHAQGLLRYVPYHPRATIAPRQRFLTKGGYVLPVENGVIATADAEWILP